MSFTNIGGLDHHLKFFLSPRDLIKLESVSKSNISNLYQWKNLGYEDKSEFKQIVDKLLTFCETDDTKNIFKEFILTGQIRGVRRNGTENRVKHYSISASIVCQWEETG